MKVCNYCGSRNEERITACEHCGASDFSIICENCGEVFDTPFCPNCGESTSQVLKHCDHFGASLEVESFDSGIQVPVHRISLNEEE